MDEQHKCPWCDVIKPLRGLACHVGKTHKRSVEELHREVLHGGVTPTCACGCGQPVRWLQRRFGEYLRGHNGFSRTAREAAFKVRALKLAAGELTSWNKGLTKETDARVARHAEKISASANGAEISRRLAARSDEAKSEHRARLATSLKRTYDEGRQPWNEGLTKETSLSLALVAEKNRAHARRRFSWSDKPELVEAAALSRSTELRLADGDGYDNKHSALLFECLKCKASIKRSLHVLRYSPGCPACAGNDTKPQLEIYAVVKDLCSDAISSDASTIRPQHLDVHVPSRAFAIEYNGLYWHSEKFRSRGYHQNKTDICRVRGIDLLHVYADDWQFRQPIVVSMIRHRLGVSTRRLYARSCSIVQLDRTTREEFFKRCHLDGDVASKVAFGLEHDGQIVAALSLRKPFHAKWKSYIEVGRFATELNTAVVGGLSRLVKAAVAWAQQHEYDGLLSYVDGRVGEGNGYVSAGFELVSKTPPMFWWTDYVKRYNRFNYRADKKRRMSEHEVADEAGMTKIYGCQNAVMVLPISSP